MEPPLERLRIGSKGQAQGCDAGRNLHDCRRKIRGDCRRKSGGRQRAAPQPDHAEEGIVYTNDNLFYERADKDLQHGKQCTGGAGAEQYTGEPQEICQMLHDNHCIQCSDGMRGRVGRRNAR